MLAKIMGYREVNSHHSKEGDCSYSRMYNAQTLALALDMLSQDLGRTLHLILIFFCLEAYGWVTTYDSQGKALEIQLSD